MKILYDYLSISCVILVLTYMPLSYAETNTYPATGTVENALDANNQRLHMQIKYALQTREAITGFIFAWQNREQVMPSKTTLNKFTRQLLYDGTDPIVTAVAYEPNQWLSIKIADTRFIEPLLRGVELVYRFTPMQPVTEEFVQSEDLLNPDGTSAPSGAITEAGDSEYGISENIPVMPTPLFLDALHCMGIITSYCKIPQGYKASGGTWFDQEWCPAWHGYVMPPVEFINFSEATQ